MTGVNKVLPYLTDAYQYDSGDSSGSVDGL